VVSLSKNLEQHITISSPVVLTLTINNSEPIELSDFVGAFTSIAQEYRRSLKLNVDFEDDATIYVKEVRAGSIIADLVPIIAPVLPIIATHAEQVWQTVQFVKKWGERISSLAGGVVPSGFGKSDLKIFADATAAIARDPNASSTLEAATFEDGKREVRAAFKFSTKQAKIVNQTIEGEYRRLEDSSSDTHLRVAMYFTRSDVKDAPKDKRSGERVIVPEISGKDLPIIYASDLAEQRVKHEIREADDNIYKKGFEVDLLIVKRGEKPIVYKITHVHSVFDLPE
jgi:hypothetical protein